jgi:hypothetical protein
MLRLTIRRRLTMNMQETTGIRELEADELTAVSGGVEFIHAVFVAGNMRVDIIASESTVKVVTQLWKCVPG